MLAPHPGAHRTGKARARKVGVSETRTLNCAIIASAIGVGLSTLSYLLSYAMDWMTAVAYSLYAYAVLGLILMVFVCLRVLRRKPS